MKYEEQERERQRVAAWVGCMHPDDLRVAACKLADQSKLHGPSMPWIQDLIKVRLAVIAHEVEKRESRSAMFSIGSWVTGWQTARIGNRVSRHEQIEAIANVEAFPACPLE